MTVIEEVQCALGKDVYLKQDTKILLGFSGGADSLCLLHGLVRLGWKVIAAHFDHALRADSAQEAQKAAALAATLGAEWVTERGDVPGYAEEHSLSVEEAARMLRYRFLFAQARRCGAGVVAVAHNADDQVETVLMHLLRGAGLAGLKGMNARAVLPEWDTDLPLIRPLLGVWRVDIEGYCREEGLTALEDPSNQSTTYFRNRLRHELIPYLRGYNPNIGPVIWRTAQVLAGDFETLQTMVEPAWENCLEVSGSGFVGLNLPFLQAQTEGMQRSLLRRAIALLRPALRDVGLEALTRAQEFLLRPSRSGKMDLLDGLDLCVEQKHLYVMEQNARMPYPWPRVLPESVVDLEIPGQVALLDGWLLSADWSMEINPADDEWQARVDADALQLPLQLRAARVGERWQPLGFQDGTIKLSDFWINSRLPKRARKGWPLVYSTGQASEEGQVVWLPGFRPAHFCRVTEKTKRVVVLRLIPPV